MTQINDREIEFLLDADLKDYERDDPDFSEYGDNAGTIINELLETKI